ncbi:helix-turn-helix domain-containing protein [Streptomyces sp. NPDC059340]|uniref:helix-turn-helix domain-containing protein n=1 Tax=Streptomyces sp. NPDC059340 TaxID=3346806 RepID=UPI003683373F
MAAIEQVKHRRHYDSVSEALRLQIDFLAEHQNERLSVRQLSEAAGMSPSRVTATLAGRRVPNRDELDLLCMALGLGAEHRKDLQWLRTREETERAHRAQVAFAAVRSGAATLPGSAGAGGASPRAARERPRQPVPAFGQPDPIRVSSPEELIQALNAAHVWGGSPSLRELEKRSKGILRRSSISDMLRGTALPDYDRLVAFLRVCGVEGANLDTWVFVWRRLKALETPGVASWMPGAESAVL